MKIREVTKDRHREQQVQGSLRCDAQREIIDERILCPSRMMPSTLLAIEYHVTVVLYAPPA